MPVMATRRKVRRKVRRTLIAAGILLILLALWWVAVAKNYAASAASYRPVDDRTIAVQVIGGRWSWCRATAVAETDSDVRISADCLDWLPLPGTALGVLHELTVRLSQPLGKRSVTDGLGDPVTLGR